MGSYLISCIAIYVSLCCIMHKPFIGNYTPSGKKKKKKYSIVMLRKATKVHVYLQCFSLSFSKPERTS